MCSLIDSSDTVAEESGMYVRLSARVVRYVTRGMYYAKCMPEVRYGIEKVTMISFVVYSYSENGLGYLLKFSA